MKKLIKKIIMVVVNFIKYIRTGGVVYVNISQVNYGEILTGKKVVVTGGSSGIGYAIAEKFISEGAEVIITGRQIEKLEEAKRNINNNRCKVLQWDVAESKIAEAKIKEAVNMLGKIDIFINNAGIYSPKNFFDIEEEDWKKIMDTNSKGVYFIAKYISRYYVEKKLKGKIINIASIAGLMGGTNPYWISKWGIVGLTRGLGIDLASKGIIVNGIAPGDVSTPMTGIDASKNAYLDRASNKRVALPEEIAELALFLASDAANHIVGQTIVCDGGTSLS